MPKSVGAKAALDGFLAEIGQQQIRLKCPKCGTVYETQTAADPEPEAAPESPTATTQPAVGTATPAVPPLWFVWSFFPFINWIAWVHASIRSHRRAYLLFAAGYFLLILPYFLVYPGGADEKTLKAFQQTAPWFVTGALIFVSWIGGICHTLWARKTVNLEIKYATIVTNKAHAELEKRVAAQYGMQPTAVNPGKTSPPTRAKSTSPPTLEDFARKACKSRSSTTIRMNQVSKLIELLRDEAVATRPGGDPSKIFTQVMAGLTVRCPNCGQLTESAVSLLGLAGSDIMKNAVFGGPNVAALAAGCCPQCRGTVAEITFEPSGIRG